MVVDDWLKHFPNLHIFAHVKADESDFTSFTVVSVFHFCFCVFISHAKALLEAQTSRLRWRVTHVVNVRVHDNNVRRYIFPICQ